MSTWRDALTDSEHDLHQATWLLFAQSVQVDTAIEKLTEQKDTVKPLLMEIIEDDYLFEADAPGDGNVPPKAIELIKSWRITDALPSLLELLEFEGTLPQVANAAKGAINAFGHDVLGDVLAWANDNDDMSLAIADLLPNLAGASDEDAINWLKSAIEANDPDLAVYVDTLIKIDAKSAEGYLSDLSKNNDFDKDAQKMFRKKAKEAKKAAKQQLELALQQEKRAAEFAEMQAQFEASQAAEVEEGAEVETDAEDAPAEAETEAVAEEEVEASEE